MCVVPVDIDERPVDRSPVLIRWHVALARRLRSLRGGPFVEGHRVPAHREGLPESSPHVAGPHRDRPPSPFLSAQPMVNSPAGTVTISGARVAFPEALVPPPAGQAFAAGRRERWRLGAIFRRELDAYTFPGLRGESLRQAFSSVGDPPSESRAATPAVTTRPWRAKSAASAPFRRAPIEGWPALQPAAFPTPPLCRIGLHGGIRGLKPVRATDTTPSWRNSFVVKCVSEKPGWIEVRAVLDQALHSSVATVAGRCPGPGRQFSLAWG